MMIKEQKKDILSTLFERTIPLSERYNLGQYFTHEEIVNFIINSIPIRENNKVLDPTCGAGAFLKKILEKGLDSKNIYGSDIDPRALKLCNKNLNEQNTNLILGDFIKENLFQDNFFDVIIGNPPFKNLKSNNKDFPLESKYYREIISGVTNSASLVLSKSYFLLKEGGYMGFVLPKNFIRVDSFRKIRDFILKNMSIILIKDLDHHFKDVRCDQIVLIAQKKKPSLKNKIRIISYKKGASFLSHPEFFLTQEEFFNYSFYPLFYNDKVKSIANKLLSYKTHLSDESSIFRGISLNLIKKYISNTTDKKNLFLLRGNCIKRFGIKYRLSLKKEFLENSFNSTIKRMLQEKIIVQNLISKEGGVFSTMSKNNELTLDTITNIIPNDKKYLLFLTGLLGSKLCNFFMIHVIYLNSNFTMHADKAYLGKLPVVYPDISTKKKIDSIIKELLSEKDKYSQRFKERYNKLNNILYKIYGLKEEEIKIIEDSLKEVMSKKNG